MVQELMQGDLFHAIGDPAQEGKLRWENRCAKLLLGQGVCNATAFANPTLPQSQWPSL